jgi:hypothetical protein
MASEYIALTGIVRGGEYPKGTKHDSEGFDPGQDDVAYEVGEKVDPQDFGGEKSEKFRRLLAAGAVSKDPKEIDAVLNPPMVFLPAPTPQTNRVTQRGAEVMEVFGS